MEGTWQWQGDLSRKMIESTKRLVTVKFPPYIFLMLNFRELRFVFSFSSNLFLMNYDWPNVLHWHIRTGTRFFCRKMIEGIFNCHRQGSRTTIQKKTIKSKFDFYDTWTKVVHIYNVIPINKSMEYVLSQYIDHFTVAPKTKELQRRYGV